MIPFRTLLLGLLALGVCLPGHAQTGSSIPELETLLKKYDEEVKRRVGNKFRDQKAQLNQNYGKALQRSVEEAEAEGAFEERLALTAELLRLESGEPIPDDKEFAAPMLNKLRPIYRRDLERLEKEELQIMASLNAALFQAIDGLLLKLQEENRGDDFRLVEKRRGELLEELAGGKSGGLDGLTGSFTNSLGMKFVAVPGTDVLISIHETRRSDFTTFALEAPGVGVDWQAAFLEGVPVSTEDDQPVVNVSWEDAQAFCEWLSEREGRTYRLPTAKEWASALAAKGSYAWGDAWPPPEKAGNIADASMKQLFPTLEAIDEYSDGFGKTAPVMSFPANQLGVFDLTGNVWEWCQDSSAAPDSKERLLLGASWRTHLQEEAMASHRRFLPETSRAVDVGFRCVVEN